ncbi:unnamed protein product [Trichogramma brassicae]|uniref:Uncharacterized protein n=1 Tax=Trichogramma brassicae TaxID=86971 RepID=A0A6H5I583_9HYME|nr:unnamed protein product [Trichogramma brassicae]
MCFGCSEFLKYVRTRSYSVDRTERESTAGNAGSGDPYSNSSTYYCITYSHRRDGSSRRGSTSRAASNYYNHRRKVNETRLNNARADGRAPRQTEHCAYTIIGKRLFAREPTMCVESRVRCLYDCDAASTSQLNLDYRVERAAGISIVACARRHESHRIRVIAVRHHRHRYYYVLLHA